jgi:hypothetical protein
MIGKIRTIGLALVAVLALSAVIASAAQAVPVVTVETKGKINLDATTTEPQPFTAFGAETSCTHNIFKGEAENNSSTITVEPEYTGCTATGNLPVTVTTNGCHYLFHLTEKVSSDHYRAHVDIVCPSGKQIEVHIYANATAHAEKKSLCTLTIPPQTNLTTVTITTKTTAGNPNYGDAEISGTVEHIHALQDRNSILCPAGTETNEAIYHITTASTKAVTLTGTNPETGAATDFDISGE